VVLFGLRAIFLVQTWLNNQAEQNRRNLAEKKPEVPARTLAEISS
jgi:hypothetical protein